MYDSNNFSYSDGSFTPVEPENKPPKKSGGAGKIIAAVIAVAIIGGASGYGGAYLANMNSQTSVAASADAYTEQTSVQTTVTQAETVQTAATPLGNTSKELDSGLTTAEVIEKMTPSVAFITSKTDGTGTSTGTGIVFTSDGYIVTNAHVVNFEQTVRTNSNNDPYGYNDPFSSFFENFYGYGGGNYETVVVEAEEVTVTLSDGAEYKAEIVGSDANTDLAVLKIDASGLVPAEIGDSSALVMGDTAITLGYPLGLGLCASDGIIAGLDKEMSVEVANSSVTMKLIQTDAAINSGNSGGPLINSHGQVIGITSSKLMGSSIDGVGFAIPITDALPLINELMTTGEIKNTIPKIGITGSEITAAVKRYYNLPVDSGVLVSAVEPGSCAEIAGIAEGDVIVAADGEEVTSMDTLIALKNKHKAGETMVLTLARSDGNIDVELILDVDE
ncbi:MAG: trypsin-like peptidase domain-containing protein [Oscillospiraceae bacterium]|nr:trypsin-like peptidase domain-containing protein [Oscillospiraceae bacterium]